MALDQFVIPLNSQAIHRLRPRLQEISQAWAKLVTQRIPDPYGKLSSQELGFSTTQGISAILDALESGDTQAVENYIQTLSTTRIHQDFNIQDITHALLLSRQALLPFFLEKPDDALQASQGLDEVIQFMVSRFASLYAQALSQILHTQQQQARTLAEENEHLYLETRKHLVESQSLQRVMSALLQERSFGEVLNIVCSEAVSLTDSMGCTISLIEPDGWLKPVYSIGESAFSFEDTPLAGPMLEMALSSAQPGFTLEDDLGSILAVPLKVKDQLIGALTVSHKSRQFTDEDLLTMSRFADPAAVAIENARLYQQVERVAIMEERNRLARELHDSVTQSLYAVTLYAEAAARLLSAGDLMGTHEYLHDLRLTAQEAVKEMRLLIFELRPPVLEKEGLVAAIQARLDAVEGRAGLETSLVINLQDRLPAEVEETFYRILQEALNNVLKHSRAHKVTVTLIQEASSVTLEINDDGIGFDLSSVNERGGFGLKSMAERAEKYNCQLKIDSLPGKGTCIRVETKI